MRVVGMKNLWIEGFGEPNDRVLGHDVVPESDALTRMKVLQILHIAATLPGHVYISPPATCDRHQAHQTMT